MTRLVSLETEKLSSSESGENEDRETFRAFGWSG